MATDSASIRKKQFDDRWSSYGANSGILAISDMLSIEDLQRFEIFQGFESYQLETIRKDMSLVRWKAGSILFEEGSYLDLAFFIVSGEVDVFLKQQTETAAQPIFDTSRGAPDVEVSPDADTFGQTILNLKIDQFKAQSGKDNVSFLSTMDFDLPYGDTKRLGPGEIFGEIGALSGWPQSVTARTASECTLLQIRVPALRRMKDESGTFKTWIDAIYRERTLVNQLKTTPIFKGTDERFINDLKQNVELTSFRPGKPITQEGDPIDALYLVRSGFVKLSQAIGDEDFVVTYLSKGMTLGDVELLTEEGGGQWAFTAHAVGYAELVRIPRADFSKIIKQYPAIEKRMWEGAVARLQEVGRNKRDVTKSELLEFALEKGLVQGNSMLVIDLDTCTRCDDCMRGCASTHGGRPRFIREGEKFGNFMVARSCYHCEDPVCLIGCPTGAIRRANVGAVVEIDDNLCIGCSTCARNCPYDAIIMHDTGTTWPEGMDPEHLRGEPRLVASKCDLCHTSSAGPACVNNCPHACAIRVTSIDEFRQLSLGPEA